MTLAAVSPPDQPHRRRPTTTAAFGSSRRENHDASGFYDRFVAPEISLDSTVVSPAAVDVINNHDARDMDGVASNSVALVVTSPPYFAGKEYEQSLGEGGVPADYFEYLALLRDVFAECKRVLEPGGRIAVNVANLGRRPYRSLAGDVTTILSELGLLLRGEVVWWKGRAAGGSCAWGSFQRPTNPVLRDVTERIVIASKGRFDRALKPGQRHGLALPSVATISRDEFLEATTDLWEIPTESATRVGHPAPFPVALPQRLIELYTYEGDLVLDPFMGSGSTAVASVRTNRHYVGFETDASYVTRADQRVLEERQRSRGDAISALPFPVHPSPPLSADAADRLARAVSEGRQARELAAILLASCGFVDVRADVKIARLGLELSFVATDQLGDDWAFDLTGGFTCSPTGLRRADTLWKALGRAAVLHQGRRESPLILLSTDLPTAASLGHRALEALRGPGGPVIDVIQLLDVDDRERLCTHARRGRPNSAAG